MSRRAGTAIFGAKRAGVERGDFTSNYSSLGIINLGNWFIHDIPHCLSDRPWTVLKYFDLSFHKIFASPKNMARDRDMK